MAAKDHFTFQFLWHSQESKEVHPEGILQMN